jgi:hypothetical protein
MFRQDTDSGPGELPMAAGDITFIECPYGDSFPVRKTATRSCGIQQIVCPRCGHGFDIMLPESVERLSQEALIAPSLGEASPLRG